MQNQMQRSISPGVACAPDHKLAGLVERLSRARRRSAYSAFIAGSTVALLIALAMFCVLQLLHALLGTMGSWLAFEWLSIPAWLASIGEAPVGQHIVVAASFGLAALIAAAITAANGKPWLSSMARAADRRFRLDESMSTALEVASARDTPIGVVPLALLRTAQTRSASIDARSLIPMRLPPLALAVPLVLALAVLLVASPPPPLFERAFNAAGIGGASADGFTTVQRDEAVADLHAIAAILRQDGEQRANPVVQAIARQLELLAANLETNAALGRDTVATELERLMGLAGEAYAAAGEAAGTRGDLSRLIQAALGAIEPTRRMTAADRIGTEPPPAQATAGAEGIDAPFEAVVLHDEGGFDPAGNGLAPPGLTVNPNQMTAGEGAGNWAEPGAAPEFEIDDVYGVAGPDGPPGAGGGAGGEIVGAAGGEGDIAGIGGAALFGAATPIAAVTDGIAMLLADRAGGDGRRIRLNLPPLAELMPVEGANGLDTGGWRNFTEEQVTRAALPAPQRDAIRRYFDAMMKP